LDNAQIGGYQWPGPIYKNNWAQCKSLAVTDGVLGRQWESVEGIKADPVTPRGTLKEVVAEMPGGTSEGHLGTSKSFNKFRQRYYSLYSRSDVEKWCQ